MEKENILEIEITKINEIYSLAKVTKMNRKVIEEKKKYYFGYANSSSLETNSELHKEPNFRTYISDTISCSDLYLNSENDCFTIKNNLVASLEKFLVNFNEKYGLLYRWRARPHERFFCIYANGEISTTQDDYGSYKDSFYELGNYFETEIEAKRVLDSKEWQEFWEKVRAGEIGNENRD